MNHDAGKLDAAELTSQIEMSQFTIDQLTMRERRPRSQAAMDEARGGPVGRSPDADRVTSEETTDG